MKVIEFIKEMVEVTGIGHPTTPYGLRRGKPVAPKL